MMRAISGLVPSLCLSTLFLAPAAMADTPSAAALLRQGVDPGLAAAIARQETPDLRQSESDRETRPVLAPAPVLAAAERVAPAPRVVAPTKKRIVQMPWQTGVFQ